MIPLELIKNYFPPGLRDKASFQKYMLKEYIQLAILDFLSTTPFIGKIVFIGGTNLRLVKGIDRFSEDLDFDCKSFTREEFMEMTDAIFQFLHRSGMRVEVRDRENKRLKAFRRSFHFPELMITIHVLRIYASVKSRKNSFTYRMRSLFLLLNRRCSKSLFFKSRLTPLSIFSDSALSSSML